MPRLIDSAQSSYQAKVTLGTNKNLLDVIPSLNKIGGVRVDYTKTAPSGAEIHCTVERLPRVAQRISGVMGYFVQLPR